MSQKRKAVLCLGFCISLAACDDTSTRDLTGPELSKPESADVQRSQR